jgi:predicted S18 family serine protease
MTRWAPGTGKIELEDSSIPLLADFEKSINSAMMYARSKNMWTEDADASWLPERIDGVRLPQVAGPSMGLALALGFLKLHVGDGATGVEDKFSQKVAGLYLENVAATGELGPDGSVLAVGGIEDKLHELLTNANCFESVRALLVSEAQTDCLNPTAKKLIERLKDVDGPAPSRSKPIDGCTLYNREDGRLLPVIPVSSVEDAVKKIFTHQALNVL